MNKKVVYIAGPITGVENYWESFEEAEERVTGLGYIALTPSRLPKGMDNAQYMRICFAMIDSADAVVFLPNLYQSRGATLEHAYCEYTGKPTCYYKNGARNLLDRNTYPDEVALAWLKHDLEEALK